MMVAMDLLTAPMPPAPDMTRAYLASDASYDGIFYLGVRTTGIFCRPSCPARKPKPENVEFFAQPQDALGAGYRPCLRCRPLDDQQAPEWAKTLLARLESAPGTRWRDQDLRAGRQPGIVHHLPPRGVDGLLRVAHDGRDAVAEDAALVLDEVVDRVHALAAVVGVHGEFQKLAIAEPDHGIDLGQRVDAVHVHENARVADRQREIRHVLGGEAAGELPDEAVASLRPRRQHCGERSQISI